MPRSKEAVFREPSGPEKPKTGQEWAEGTIEIKSFEQIEGEKRAEEEKKNDKIADAKRQLQDLLKKEKGPSFYADAEKIYKEITGESLAQRARESAHAATKAEAQEAVARGEKPVRLFLSKSDYLTEQNIKAAQKWFKNKERSDYWSGLGQDAKKEIEGKYGNVDGYVKAKTRELADKTGFAVSEDAVFEMIRRGIKTEEIKKTGWFFKKIQMPPSAAGLSGKMSKTEFQEWTGKIEKNIEDEARQGGINELNRIIAVGKGRAEARKEKHIIQMLQDASQQEKPKISHDEELSQRIHDLKDLRVLNKALPELLQKLVTKRKRIKPSFEPGKEIEKKSELLSGSELDYLKKLGLDASETQEVEPGKIVKLGKSLEAKLEGIAKRRKLGNLPADEESEFLQTLKNFVIEEIGD